MCIYSYSFLCLLIISSVWARAPTASSAHRLDCVCWGRIWAQCPNTLWEPEELPPSPGLPCPKEAAQSGLSLWILTTSDSMLAAVHSHFIVVQGNSPCFALEPNMLPKMLFNFILESRSYLILLSLCSVFSSTPCMRLSRGRESSQDWKLACAWFHQLLCVWSLCHSITNFSFAPCTVKWDTAVRIPGSPLSFQPVPA